jgi:hypothetical protein
LKARLDRFVDSHDGRRKESSEDADLEALEADMRQFDTFVRENRDTESAAWTWHSKSMTFEAVEAMANGEISWQFYLRNAILNEVCSDSIAWTRYCGFLRSLKLACNHDRLPTLMRKLLDADQEKHRLKLEKEEKLRQEEEDKAKKGGKAKVDPKKADPKKTGDKKREADDEKLEVEVPKLNTKKSIVEQPVIEGRRRPVKRRDDAGMRLFEVVGRQTGHLPIETLTPGIILEAFCDEIEMRLEGSVESQLTGEDISRERYLKEVLDGIFDSLLESK